MVSAAGRWRRLTEVEGDMEALMEAVSALATGGRYRAVPYVWDARRQDHFAGMGDMVEKGAV